MHSRDESDVMKQQRHYCETCKREWVYAHSWDESQGCPGCHSSAIGIVEYRADFPGGDIPRSLRPVEAPTPVEVEPVAAGLVLTMKQQPQIDLWQMI
jgi:hypothetical protein